MSNTEILISELEFAVKYGHKHLDFMVGKYTGNNPSVIKALERKGYTVEKLPRTGNYRLLAK